MNRHSIKAMLVATAAAAFASATALAADPASKPEANPAGKADMHHGMMMGGSKSGGSMMDMMQSCQSMMGNGAMSGSGGSTFKLPPGNEKLETQMHAEMPQKMGEIAAKYADRVKEGK